MNQSIGAMIAKIAAGLFCIAAMFQESVTEVGTVVAGCVIGLALIAWGVVPFVKEKLDEKKEAARKAEQAEKRRLEAEAQRKEESEKPKYCKRCGASTKGKVCEYCGSPLDE